MTILTCVYCGKEYPEGTPSWGDKVLTDHIKFCEAHPLRAAELKIEKLRKALFDMIGVSSEKELKEMEAVLRSIPGIETDKVAAINAIHALLETSSEK